MSNTIMLRRDAVSKDITSDLVETLPEEAYKVLGYTMFKARKERLRLRNALAELGIRPFTAQSVAKYEAAMLKKHGATFWARHPGLFEATAGTSCVLSFFSLIAGLVMLVAACVTWFQGTFDSLLLCKWFMGIYAVGVPSFIYFLTALHTKEKSKKEAEWKTVEIGDCKQQVPAFALETAIKVKKAIPEASIMIKYLLQEKFELDPFLVVSVRSGYDKVPEEYHIEVWDEPSFDKQRQV